MKKWSLIASYLNGRLSKQCRERWLNHLDPSIKKDAWTPEEDAIVIDAHRVLGNKWAQIAQRLQGRSDNAIKNRFNSTLQGIIGKGAEESGEGGCDAENGAALSSPQWVASLSLSSSAGSHGPPAASEKKSTRKARTKARGEALLDTSPAAAQLATFHSLDGREQGAIMSMAQTLATPHRNAKNSPKKRSEKMKELSTPPSLKNRGRWTLQEVTR